MSRLDRAPCGYIAFGDDQRISDLNREAARMLDRTKQQLLGLPIAEVLAPRTRIFFNMHVYPALSLHGEISEVYVSLQKPGGEEVATVMSATWHDIDGRKLVECAFLPMRRRRIFELELIEGRRAALAAARAEQAALEQLKTAQSQLAVQDQLASLGMLAAGVAHEINNPLAYVSSNLELLETQFAARTDAEELRHLVADASEGVTRIREIVRGLRTLSRMEDRQQHTSVELQGVLDVAARMAGSQIRYRAQLELQVGTESLVVPGDAGRVGQVLLNLLINAAQALPEGRSENRVCLRAFREGDRAILEVEDNGPGIALEVQPRIFDPFFTTKPVGVGTGLGLSVCKSILAALGGTIGVRSAPGEGACFRVSLPLATRARSDAPAPIQPPTAAVSPAPRSAAPAAQETVERARVLIIDDDLHVTRVIALALRQFEVTVVNHSRDALDLLAAREFDVILCDLMMPEVTGMDIHRELLAHRPELARRIIFLTGGTFSAEAEDFMATVQNRCIQKPFSNAALREACSEMARSRLVKAGEHV